MLSGPSASFFTQEEYFLRRTNGHVGLSLSFEEAASSIQLLPFQEGVVASSSIQLLPFHQVYKGCGLLPFHQVEFW
jgi:hypothetical protein